MNWHPNYDKFPANGVTLRLDSNFDFFCWLIYNHWTGDEIQSGWYQGSGDGQTFHSQCINTCSFRSDLMSKMEMFGRSQASVHRKWFLSRRWIKKISSSLLRFQTCFFTPTFAPLSFSIWSYEIVSKSSSSWYFSLLSDQILTNFLLFKRWPKQMKIAFGSLYPRKIQY